jgi:signal peptidase I
VFNLDGFSDRIPEWRRSRLPLGDTIVNRMRILKTPLDTAVSENSRQNRNAVAEWAITILLLLFGTTTLCQAFVIPTGSMEDTLRVGDHLLVDKLAYAPAGSIGKYLLPYEEPKHGDIIVFRYPPDINQTLVKRLIGMPGDRIRIANGVVYRNGKALNEPYVYHKYAYNPALDNFPWPCCRPVKEDLARRNQEEMLNQNVSSGELLVPEHHYFGMGDNRDNSSDSRYWGFIPRENIIGKPFLIYWSYRASTEDLSGETASSVLRHTIDLAEHFFTRTRWDRTFKLVRGFPDSELPQEPLPVNPGLSNP